MKLLPLFLLITLGTSQDVDTVGEQRMKEDIENIKRELTRMKDTFETEIAELKIKCSHLLGTKHGNITENIFPMDAVSTTENVAFHARIGSNLAIHDNELIRFDIVETNLGSAYNPASGLFRAPQSGYYAFSVNLLVFDHKNIEAFLVNNGAVLLNIFAASDNNAYNSGSNLVVTQLTAGDDVWVKVHGTFHSSGNILDGAWCTFSGFWLYPS